MVNIDQIQFRLQLEARALIGVIGFFEVLLEDMAENSDVENLMVVAIHLFRIRYSP